MNDEAKQNLGVSADDGAVTRHVGPPNFSETPNSIELMLATIIIVAKTISGVLIYSIFIFVLLQVLMRYVFSLPLYWVEEFVKFQMSYLITIGAAAALVRNLHPRLSIITSLVPDRYQLPYELFLRIPTIALSIVFVFVGYNYALVNDWNSPALGVSYYWAYLSIPIGGIFIFIVLILDSINIVIFRRSFLANTQL